MLAAKAATDDRFRSPPIAPGTSRGVSDGTRTHDRLDHNRIPRDFLGGGQSSFAGSSWFELLALLLKLMDRLMDAARAKAALTISASFAAGASSA
jgi:hypothetical protein